MASPKPSTEPERGWRSIAGRTIVLGALLSAIAAVREAAFSRNRSRPIPPAPGAGSTERTNSSPTES